MSRNIDYENLMHTAMCALIKNVLEDVAAHGLPGSHHFFITFDTGHPDVRVADWLAHRYPDQMTVVMQHWYANLDVGSDGFTVTLNFGNRPERLYIPYNAIKTFVDPSVEFGLRLENTDADTPQDPTPTSKPKIALVPDKVSKQKDGDIVSLDSFRK
ncbi:MAG: hypothetical protein GDA36_12485 [Rhodobacteraceae bacterium]|nr:hypothetical protein [Paracoccaceae bacterium]